ncbi:MAG: hypothetical protein N4A71_10980 [Carboxylicivirga sp.]|jgi:hypothetical protein|nr:hypothetical protein [Carboxylicivirga sp.]
MPKSKKRAFDNQQSRVKLMVYDKENNGKAFYSFLKDDKKGYEHTINAMKERILQKLYRRNFNNAIFYNTATDSVIERISPDKFAQVYAKNKVKLVIYDSKNQKHTRYSTLEDDKQSIDYILGVMNERYLKGVKINAAMFYDVETGQQLAKHTGYGRA